MFSLHRDFSGSSSSTTLPDEDNVDEDLEEELRGLATNTPSEQTELSPVEEEETPDRLNLLHRMNASRRHVRIESPHSETEQFPRRIAAIRSDSQLSEATAERVEVVSIVESHEHDNTIDCCGCCNCSHGGYESFQVIYYPPFEMPYFRKYTPHPLIHPYLHLPFAITQAFNLGDHDKIRELLVEFTDEKCLFSTTACEHGFTGMEYVLNFFSSLLSAHPDGVLKTKGFCYTSIPDSEHPDQMLRSVSSSFNFVGTRRFPSTIQDLHLHQEELYHTDVEADSIRASLREEYLFKDPHAYLSDYMDPSRFSVEELQLLREIERHASQVELVLHGTWTMMLENLSPNICPLNLYNDLIVGVNFVWEVTSFRNAGRPTIL